MKKKMNNLSTLILLLVGVILSVACDADPEPVEL